VARIVQLVPPVELVLAYAQSHAYYRGAMDWGSFSLGLGGLSVGALSLWLNYRERTQKLREALYTRHAEAFAEILPRLADLHMQAQSFIVMEGCILNSKTRPELRLKIASVDKIYREALQRWYVFLPDAVISQLETFRTVLNGISSPDPNSSLYPPEYINSKDPGLLLSQAYTAVITVTRKYLGVEQLTAQTLKLIGEPKP
jgi:hypothetical protein